MSRRREREAATELTTKRVAWWLPAIVLLGALVRGMYLP